MKAITANEGLKHSTQACNTDDNSHLIRTLARIMIYVYGPNKNTASEL